MIKRIVIVVGILITVGAMAADKLVEAPQPIIVGAIAFGTTMVIVFAINWSSVKSALGVTWERKPSLGRQKHTEYSEEDIEMIFDRLLRRHRTVEGDQQLPEADLHPKPAVPVRHYCRDCLSTNTVYEKVGEYKALKCLDCGWRDRTPKEIVDDILRRHLADGSGEYNDGDKEAADLSETIELSRYKATRPIEKVVSPRLASVLRKNGIKTLGTLIKTKERDLKRINGIGRDSMAEIRELIDRECNKVK